MLIEPSKDYQHLIDKNRKARSLNVCLATKTVPHEVEFYNYDMVGGIKGSKQVSIHLTKCNHKSKRYQTRKMINIDFFY